MRKSAYNKGTKLEN